MGENRCSWMLVDHNRCSCMLVDVNGYISILANDILMIIHLSMDIQRLCIFMTINMDIHGVKWILDLNPCIHRRDGRGHLPVPRGAKPKAIENGHRNS